MKNIDLNDVNNAVEKALAATKLDPNTAAKVKSCIIQNLREAIEEEQADEENNEKEPRQKSQYVIMVSDPKKLITEDLTGWVLQIPDNESVAIVKDKVNKALYDFNVSKKGRLQPVKTIGEGFESVKPKFFKEYEIKVKTKTPVYVVVTNNILPKEN